MTMGCSRAFFELDDQESMAILALVLGFASIRWPVLAANLSSCDVDCPKMLATPLMDKAISDIVHSR